MAGLSTAGVRALCLRLGAGAASTGLVDAAGLAGGSAGSLRRAHRGEDAGPQILQLFAAEAGILGRAVRRAGELGFQGVELNLGCPAGPVVERGCGSALLGHWDTVRSLLDALATAGLPAGVKCRSGRRPGDEDFLILHGLAAERGLDWYCLHPRSLAGAYHEPPDWSLVDRLPRTGPRLWAVGDLCDAPAARAALERHPALEAVLIGRAALSAPWIFALCQGRPAPEPAEQAAHLTELLTALASDLDWQEGRRILPGLLRHFGLPAGEDAQFRLADRRRSGQWQALLLERLQAGPLPVMRDNPFLKQGASPSPR
jgi:tRNA-dihydrouridine synthase